MELKDLIGERVFSGIDFENGFEEGEYKDSSCVNFILDGKTYTVIEDPDDGYRSSMQDIIESDKTIKNLFPKPVRVVARMSDEFGEDILQLIDISNGKTVLEIGTDYSDHWYPCFVASFSPENFSL